MVLVLHLQSENAEKSSITNTLVKFSADHYINPERLSKFQSMYYEANLYDGAAAGYGLNTADLLLTITLIGHCRKKDSSD